MTPSLQWEEFEIEAGRTIDYLFKLYKSDGSPAGIEANDVVRFKIARRASDATPLLDVDSLAATDNGSLVTVVDVGVEGTSPAQILVRFAQADTIDFDYRTTHHGELSIVDASETAPANAIKRCGYGSIDVKASIGGDIGLT